jgi:hypothetical protein
MLQVPAVVGALKCLRTKDEANGMAATPPACGMPIIAVLARTSDHPAATNPGRSSFLKEIGMRVFVTIAAAGAFIATTAIAAVSGLALATSAIAVAAERPSFEMKSFPVSPAQVAILGALDVRE